MKFQVGDKVWLNIKNFRLPKGLSHKFMGPYAGPFKVLEKKFSDTYKSWRAPKSRGETNLRVSQSQVAEVETWKHAPGFQL